MKRKNILLIHFLFWFYIINQALFPLYIGQIDQAYLISNKYLKDILITTLMNVFSFYLIYCTSPTSSRSDLSHCCTGLQYCPGFYYCIPDLNGIPALESVRASLTRKWCSTGFISGTTSGS
jgi:hypothetical protein